MAVKLAMTEDEIRRCYPILSQLRPHLEASQWIAQVKRQSQSGYQLAMMTQDEKVVAVAGFRVGESFAWGKFLYVDDLVTAQDARSRGYGGGLLTWLKQYAVAAGCGQLHLDCGIQRLDAHRFYERQGMTRAAYHFVETL